MGNLPNSRTLTINTNDPVPSALVNELQDMIIGARRAAFTRRFFPKVIDPGLVHPWFQTAIQATGPGVRVPVWASSSTGDTIVVEIPYEAGETITGLKYQATGDGSVDVVSTVIYAPTLNTLVASQVTLGTITDSNRASATFGDVVIPSFVSQVLADGSFLILQIAANAANYRLGTISASYTR